MKLKYNIRLLVQYEIKADSFNEAMLRANRNVMPNNGDVVQYHYIDKNEKRYVFDYHNMSLTEVDTFGSIKPLTVVETSLGCLAPLLRRAQANLSTMKQQMNITIVTESHKGD